LWQIVEALSNKMGSAVIRLLLVLTPLAMWMMSLGPADGVAVAADEATGREVFVQNCALCHVHGVAMAPRVDNQAEWRPRLLFGRRVLLNSVLRGKGGMPPKGGNASISDEQAAAGLDYMLEQVSNLKARSRLATGQ
jgi:cytochrome c5